MADIQLITKINSSKKDYEVMGIDTIDEVVNYINSLQAALVVIDKNVYNLHKHLHTLQNIFIFESIESHKEYTYTNIIFNVFIEKKIKKNSKVVVIGGGIVQDCIGFCASIYARGISYYLLPTTLLSQCDSCIGGKTSINFQNKKNLIGTFYPPEKIIICTNFLNTLSQNDFLSGMGEIFKFACLKNEILDFDKQLNQYLKKENISQLIIDSLIYKASIIEIDEFDEKERKFLNFGHTFGHAIESVSNFAVPHGSAVILGILIAYYVSQYLGIMTLEKISEVEKISKKLLFHLSFQKEWFNYQELLECILSDKKNTGQIVMVLPHKNNQFQLKSIKEDMLEDAYQYAFNKLSKQINLIS